MTPGTQDYRRQFTAICTGLMLRTLGIAIVGAVLLLAALSAGA